MQSTTQGNTYSADYARGAGAAGFGAQARHDEDKLAQAQRRIASLEGRIAALELYASTDPVTGLLNRRGFTDAFLRELDRTNRGHSTGGLLILIDMDNFQSILDMYGTEAGDAALRLLGKTLSSDTRAMDACARLGHDEFVMLLADTVTEQALVRAQTMIRKLNSLSLVWYGAEIPLRASLALKEYGAGDHPEDIFKDMLAQTTMMQARRTLAGADISIPAGRAS